MVEKLKQLGKGLKHMVDERIEAVRIYMSYRGNRIVLGLILLGLGTGLVLSGYIPMPEY